MIGKKPITGNNYEKIQGTVSFLPLSNLSIYVIMALLMNMEVLVMSQKKTAKVHKPEGTKKPAKKKKKISLQKIVIYTIIATFLITGLLSGMAGMGAFYIVFEPSSTEGGSVL